MIKRFLPLATAVGVTILAMVFAPDVAWAEKRVALVVGNSKYQTVPQLPNPSRDANSVADMFRNAGFDTVEIQLNVGNLEFKRSIRRFETLADQADFAVVYYAGHGLELGGVNYLIPTDARLASDRDAEDEAIPLERLVSSADGARRLRLIILDACRDNPFVTTMRRERKTATRAVLAGLGRVEPTSTDTLIAYAAKAGSTAEDGSGEHSPFTTALLKNLTVPGLDVRLAFGRVRDEVMKATANKQEPFVYGSLGGGNISLVPAPAVAREAPASDVKADYELVQKIGSKRAWEVFLGTHPSGFYSDLARAQIEEINKQQANVQLAALPQAPPPSVRETPTREAIEWDKLRDSTDIGALQRFIKRFPDSPLAITAQQRVDVLNQALREREETARAEREAARKAAEEAQRAAEARKAELAAQKKREDDERRAREAEAAEKARVAAAEAAAARKREEDERRAKALEAEQKAKAAEAERKASEAKARAEQAERERVAAEAAAQKAAAEKHAKAAEEAQRAKVLEAERKAAEEKRKAEAEAAAARAVAEKQAKEAEEARRKAELAAAREAVCKSEQGKLEDITRKGSDGTGLEDLKAFARTVTCDRLGGVVVAALDKFKAEVAKRAATMPNSPELIRSAQAELIRIGCLTGKVDGTLNQPTSTALSRYMKIGGQLTENVSVTETLVTELTKHATRVCPIECKSGEVVKGDTCVAEEKKAAPAVAAKPKSDDDASRRKQQAARPERAKPAQEAVAPRAKQQAVARPSIVSGGGGHSTMIGVGF
ncbi:caspase family protein [Bradyrhizobium sp.]|uniref:caspase family protein n=1 Tax=Bradyrhizobium sp. TaxID=376 RepID=UPI001DDA2748|nr:caspase family protein [Bradyrhizobium sp.]MBI5318460.1 caspase family protein [Bradyrhizobium sp.]